ncbi:hypothetical protein SEUCBS139899_004001 [Sporothrix eucalyptigena]|uniref:Uncharacterized protein n=1 Tax=Sporothrix eucalyptigena TaxID=1812306 RepID=A0ABP0AMW2_9PEZI
MKRPAIDQLVYEHMLPRPKASDPLNFAGLLTRFLVFEVRQEVHSFYGHLDTQEAKYPGLDYCHPIHRIRLSRWPWHRRLFRAFDALRLTPTEIANLTKWEGTRWAKERYEKEQNITILDTAADDMPDCRHVESWLDDQPHAVDDYVSLLTESHALAMYESRETTTDDCLVTPAVVPSRIETVSLREIDTTASYGEDQTMNDADGGRLDDNEDVEIRSIGIQLNERLRERVAAHNAGDTSQPLDEDWEQWLKNAIETGNLNMVAQHMPLADLPFVHSRYTSQASADANSTPDPTSQPSGHNVGQISGEVIGDSVAAFSNIMPSQILHSARQGNWDEVPDFLHDVMRQTIEAESYREATATAHGTHSSMHTLAATAALHGSSSGNRSRNRNMSNTNWLRTIAGYSLSNQ